jgi:hypothetical protein
VALPGDYDYPDHRFSFAAVRIPRRGPESNRSGKTPGNRTGSSLERDTLRTEQAKNQISRRQVRRKMGTDVNGKARDASTAGAGPRAARTQKKFPERVGGRWESR